LTAIVLVSFHHLKGSIVSINRYNMYILKIKILDFKTKIQNLQEN